MRYLKYFENSQNEALTIGEYIEDPYGSMETVNKEEWKIAEIDQSYRKSHVLLINCRQIDLQVKLIKDIGDCFRNNNIYKVDFYIKIPNTNFGWENVTILFRKSQTFDMHELLENVNLYNDNYINDVYTLLTDNAVLDLTEFLDYKTFPTYDKFLDFNKRVEELKIEHSYLFDAKNMGLL